MIKLHRIFPCVHVSAIPRLWDILYPVPNSVVDPFSTGIDTAAARVPDYEHMYLRIESDYGIAGGRFSRMASHIARCTPPRRRMREGCVLRILTISILLSPAASLV